MVNKKLIDQYKDCKLCLNCDHSNKIYGYGNLKAEIAVVNEGPGNEEAGLLLDKILLAIDLKKEDLYFTTAILCRPDKDRQPTKAEYSNCRKRLFDELYIIKPHITLLVGDVALKTVMGDANHILQSHGQWFTGLSLPCYFYFSIIHPAWILRSATEGETKIRKQLMWTDIKEFREGMKTFNDSINWKTVRDDIVDFKYTKEPNEII